MNVFQQIGDKVRNMVFGEEEISPFQSTAFKTKEEAVSYVKKELKRRQDERRPYELSWILVQNFLQNNQYCEINIARNTIDQLDKLYDWEERRVFNRMTPIYRARLSKLGKIKPDPLARPTTSEAKDINRAKVSTMVAKGVNRKEHMNEKAVKINAWMEATGACFVKHIWNVRDGRKLADLNGQPVYEGDINKVIVSPFEFFPDSNFAEGIAGCRSVIHAKAYHVDDIEEKWGKKLKGRKVDAFTLDLTNIGAGGMGLYSTSARIVQTQLDDHEIVAEYTCLPCKRFPKGITMVVAGNELLDYVEMAYNVEEGGKPGLPYDMYSCIENPGYFWPMSIMEMLIDTQRSYNAVKNKKQEALNRKAIGILDIEDDGNLDTEDLEAEGLYPGKILTHARGAQPARFLENRSSTSDFDTEEALLKKEFESISGVSAFSIYSAPPTGVESGKGMEQVREQDDSIISLTAENINLAVIRSARIDLLMYKQFSNGPRVLRYVGENNDVQVFDWLSSDLTADDIVIEKEDALAQTISQRRQTVVELLQYGFFKSDIDPKVRSRFMNMMEMGNWEDIDNIDELHRNKAIRENMNVRKGLVKSPDPYDNHELHILEHNRDRLDIEYEQFREKYPLLAAMHDQHIKIHEQALSLQQQMAMAQQQEPKMLMAGQNKPPENKEQEKSAQ